MKNILLLLLFLCSALGLSAQCIYFPSCPGEQSICDLSNNNAEFWNESYWWDASNQMSDLAESTASLSATAVDSCVGATLSVKYVLFLDLNNDGTWETVIKSWEPPAPGTVNYNNYNNPNFDGGDVRIFDERPVPTTEKYQFALETIAVGDTLTGKLRWNTTAAPGVFIDPELPHAALHKIKWIFEDNLGENSVCEYTVPVLDCKSPAVVCINGLTVNIMPTQQITLWASDFLQYAIDNTTPTTLLDLAVRKAGTGTGFPQEPNGDPIQSVTYDCSELGIQDVEIWSRDVRGLADYCLTFVEVTDNFNNCGGGGNSDEPVVVCKAGQTLRLQADDMVNLSTSFVLHVAYDNVTPSNALELGIRKVGSGTGFPENGQGEPIQSILLTTADIGTVLVELWVRDEDGYTSYCETNVLLEAYQGNSGNAPTVVCTNGLSINIMPTGVIQVWATDFLQYAEDDNTPNSQILFGIRKTGTGTGFPVDNQGNPLINVTYNCNQLGVQPIELWAQDLDGNASFCETTILVQDNLGNCNGTQVIDDTICIIRWCDGAPIPMEGIEMMGSVDFAAPFLIPLDTISLIGNGCYHYQDNIPGSGNLTISPVLDTDHLNGVTPLDLVKISRHILGLEALPTFGIIAADVNKSGTVTSFDIVESRKLILGIYQAFPSNTSWRFVDAAYVFPNPANPFFGVFPEGVQGDEVSFIALKVGDVDCDATPEAKGEADDRQVRTLELPDALLAQGETVDIPVSFAAAGAWLGIQAGLEYDPALIEIEAIIPGGLPELSKQDFASPRPGALNMVWFVPEPYTVSAGEKICTLRLRARAALRLSEVLRLAHKSLETTQAVRAEGYDAQEIAYNFELRYRVDLSGKGARHQIFQAQPNPTSGAAFIPVELASAETLRLMLTDISGKLLLERQFESPAGAQRVEIPASVTAEPGIYFWQLKAGETLVSGKLVRI